MSSVRIALANIHAPRTPAESVALATAAIGEAGRAGALLVCFPEAYVPGYRWPGGDVPPPDAEFLERAWAEIATAARDARVAVILGTERVTTHGLQLSALVIDADGQRLGWQDKGQLDPDEEVTYPAFGAERRVFTVGPMTFGVVICHEGWRYPETVRWAVRHGAQVVFHPHASVADPGAIDHSLRRLGKQLSREGGALSRGREHVLVCHRECGRATGRPTTSAFVRPDGTLLTAQPYGVSGLLLADLDLDAATRRLAVRCRDWPA